LGCFFPNADHIIFQLNHPSCLVTLLTWLHYWSTSWLYLPTPYLPTFYFFMTKPISLA
jgi:hypothetical protein